MDYGNPPHFSLSSISFYLCLGNLTIYKVFLQIHMIGSQCLRILRDFLHDNAFRAEYQVHIKYSKFCHMLKIGFNKYERNRINDYGFIWQLKMHIKFSRSCNNDALVT